MPAYRNLTGTCTWSWYNHNMFRITYLVDDKHLATALRGVAGIAHELEVVPVVNAVASTKGVRARTDGPTYEVLLDHMRKENLTEINGPDARSIFKSAGFPGGSYSYHLQRAVNDKKLKKLGATKSGKGQGMKMMRYGLVTLREVKS